MKLQNIVVLIKRFRKSKNMPRPRNNETRENILRCAYNRFITSDYESVLLKDIAQDAGITTTLLHHYFPAKADLIIHIIYDMLVKTISFIDENDLKDNIQLEGEEAEGYAVMFATFNYMFDVLCRNNGRMLNAYSYVICDTKLMNEVVDFCNDNFNIPTTVDTIQKRYGQYIFWGGMSQIVALSLKKRLHLTIREAMRDQYRAFLVSINTDETIAERILEAGDKMSMQADLDQFYVKYTDSMDHFINCEW